MKDNDVWIVNQIDQAFSKRSEPVGRIILDKYNLSHYLEARRLDNYLRKSKGIVDRSNYALVSFIYLKEDAALWVLPTAMKSLIINFKSDDFFIDVIAGVLADGMPGNQCESQGDLGVRMHRLAEQRERDAVCAFCRWLKAAVPDAGGGETLEQACRLWGSE